MKSGVVGKIIDWILHPINSEGTIPQWVAGLALILIVSFLWSTVIRYIAPAAKKTIEAV